MKLRPAASLEDIVRSWGDCTRCGLSEIRKKIVHGGGNPKSRVLLVAEAPGEQEDRSGSPFQGKAGNKLNEFLEAAGIDRDRDLFITNTVACRPFEFNEDTGCFKNRRPSPEEIQACSPRLQKIFKLVDPLILILAGRTATNSLFPFGAPEKIKNTIVHHVTHPAAFLYGDRDESHEVVLWASIGNEIRSLDLRAKSGVDWSRMLTGQLMITAKGKK